MKITHTLFRGERPHAGRADSQRCVGAPGNLEENSKSTATLRRWTVPILLGIGGFVCGFLMAAHKLEPAAAGGSSRRAESVDYFLRDSSFSEVENTQLRLRALADRRISALRARRAELNAERRDVVSDDDRASYDRRVVELFAAMRTATRAFRGTAHEFLFTQDLLRFSERENLFEEWLNTYLDFLYRNPTHGLVDRFAADAMDVGRALGREQDVTLARDYIRRIPHHLGAQEIAVVIGGVAPSDHEAEFRN